MTTNDQAPDPGRDAAGSLLTFRVATKHFQDGLSNLEIARELGISRFRVARLLENAVASGVVETRVVFPLKSDDQLSRQVAERFGLTSAQVLAGKRDERWQEHAVAAMCIHHVGTLLKDGAQLGLAWGRTLDAVTRTGSHLKLGLPRADVVQLVGGVPSSTGSLLASDLVRRFARLTGGRSIVINAPLVVPTPEVADGLRAERSISAALKAGRSVDVALFGVGFWRADESNLLKVLTDADRNASLDSGVVADVCGIPIDEAGAVVKTELAARIVGITAPELRQIPRRVAVVLGHNRTAGLRAVLESGLVTDVVIDGVVARNLL